MRAVRERHKVSHGSGIEGNTAGEKEHGSSRDNGLEMTFAKSCLYKVLADPNTFPPVVVVLFLKLNLRDS